ncbi:MAG: sodium/solute symporter, partial [Pseudomonadota bacterium]
MNTSTLATLALYFVAMIGIGFYAWRKSTDTSEGYLLAGRNLPPAVAALSAGASDMSGWLLLGLPGALYVSGLSASWIGIGLFMGAVVNWIVVAPRLREQTESYGNSLTIPQFLANRFPEQAIALRVISAIVIVIFFTVYSAASLVGGGELFETAFAGLLPDIGMSDYMMGVIITALVVLAYTMVGGFLAVSLTDFVQGVIMMLALVIMPLVIMFGSGGDVGGDLAQVPIPGFLSFTEGLTLIGFISLITWGLGYFGQPHIIVRFMAIDTVERVAKARNVALVWMAISLIGAVGVGLAGRAYSGRIGDVLPDSDAQTIFIVLSDLLFHPFVTGFLYAALLAAIMSTISSQLLVSSSSLTEDFYRLFFRKEC